MRADGGEGSRFFAADFHAESSKYGATEAGCGTVGLINWVNAGTDNAVEELGDTVYVYQVKARQR